MMHTSKIKYTNLHIILCQVIIHHNHNLLIWDPIFVDNLVRMTCISLKEKDKNWGQWCILTVWMNILVMLLITWCL